MRFLKINQRKCDYFHKSLDYNVTIVYIYTMAMAIPPRQSQPQSEDSDMSKQTETAARDVADIIDDVEVDVETQISEDNLFIAEFVNG